MTSGVVVPELLPMKLARTSVDLEVKVEQKELPWQHTDGLHIFCPRVT